MRKSLHVFVCAAVVSFVACSDNSKSGNLRDVAVESETTAADTSVTPDTSVTETTVTETREPETIEETVEPETIEDIVADVEPETLDETTDETVADTEEVDIGRELLADGEACTSGEECQSGICAPTRDGRVCVAACDDDDDCPERAFCADYDTGKGVVQACLPIDTTTCAPCRSDDDCSPNGEPTVCIAFTRNLPDESVDESEGSFCVLPCEYGCAEDACFDGYCRPTDGESEVACTCSWWAVEAAAESDCARHNGFGTCDGTRTCTDQGLNDCTAETASAEVCDDDDNDCDDQVDEGTCDDGNPCTTDACNPANGQCTHTPASGASCDDHNACTATSTCFGGICIGGAATDCDDHNPCTSLACNAATGCTYAPLTGACDDNDPCTTSSQCTNGQCAAGAANNCNDNNPCTADQCVAGFGCVNAPMNGAPCDDGNACGFDEVCVGTTCTAQTTLDCADINPCTLDSCTTDRQCSHVATGLSCVSDPGYQDFCEKVGDGSVGEPNNDFTNAVLSASAQTFTTTINPIGDRDRFVMWTCSERIVRVTLDNIPNTSTAVDYEVSFHPTTDSTRHTLRDTNGGDGPTVIAFNAYANAAGPVYVTVHDWLDDDADAAKSYRLTMQALPVPDAAIEPNDRRENATAVASGEPTTAYIASLDDHDWYAIEVPAEKVLRARLTATSTDGTLTDYEMNFYTADGDGVLTWRDTNGGSGPTFLDVNHYVNDATTYYVDVHDWLDDEFDYDKPYTLILEVLDVPDAALEPNDSSNFAGSSALATPIQEDVAQAACIASVEDEDWFKFTVSAESIISLSLDNVPAISSPVDYEVTVYGPTGNELNLLRDTQGGDGTTLVQYNSYAFSPGTYYVMVHDWLDDEWDIQRCYDITVDILPVPDGADEPNDITAQATPIVTGAEHMGYIASLEDVDWYSFAVPGEKIIEPHLSMLVGPVDPEITINNTGELLLVRDTNGSDNPSSVVGAAYAPSVGNYLMQVHDWLDGDWGYSQSYTVEVELYDVPDAALEPNDSRATASPATVGGSYEGYHASDRDMDFWAFTAPASGSITLQLKTIVPSSTDYELALLDSTGSNLHDVTDQNGGNEPTQIGFTWTVTAGQTYYVRVQDFGTDSYDLAIPYTLQLQ